LASCLGGALRSEMAECDVTECFKKRCFKRSFALLCKILHLSWISKEVGHYRSSIPWREEALLQIEAAT